MNKGGPDLRSVAFGSQDKNVAEGNRGLGFYSRKYGIRMLCYYYVLSYTYAGVIIHMYQELLFNEAQVETCTS